MLRSKLALPHRCELCRRPFAADAAIVDATLPPARALLPSEIPEPTARLGVKCEACGHVTLVRPLAI